MKHRNFNTEPLVENPHKVNLKKLYAGKNVKAMHILLEPGESLKPHKTPVDVFFYVLEGNPTISIGDESAVFEKDTLIESPAHIVHWISNESEAAARILLVKTPDTTTL
ncbi:MAG: cupin domain-containing protein [Bacteroidales bacterium]|nr:cupin domain-containing protein [Bacteroidales bacterium]